MEEILREAFKEGQQWVQDANVGKVPISFNEWFKSEKTQALILHVVSKAFYCADGNALLGEEICEKQCSYCRCK